MRKKNYKQAYLDAYRAMRIEAVRRLREYGKELNFFEICKERVKKKIGDDFDEVENSDAVEDCIHCETYSCYFTGKHGYIYCMNIVAVRIKEGTEDTLEVLLQDDESGDEDWHDYDYVSGDRDSLYMSILDFIDEAK